MVCIRCKMVVKSELTAMGIDFSTVNLGEAEVQDNLSQEQYDELKIALAKWGLELLDDKKSVLIQKIKM